MGADCSRGQGHVDGPRLQIVVEGGYQNVIVESDCLRQINAISYEQGGSMFTLFLMIFFMLVAFWRVFHGVLFVGRAIGLPMN